MSSRRGFLLWAAAAVGALCLPNGVDAEPRELWPRASRSRHPDPRPGIDGSRVLTADKLNGNAEVIALFDAVREMPQIADGIRCTCGCADLEGYRSLLSCYEGDGMAQHCLICQGQARLAHKRWKEGQTLDQIRRALDARYGD